MTRVPKSEILFIYDAIYSIPNGDPFTGEQRYDDETKKILVSDVRIKRYIRDYIAQTEPDSIFVYSDPAAARPEKKADAESGAAYRANKLEPGGMTMDTFTKMIDVRLFGGIVTAKKGAINLTGPVQFALLNPSLNRVDLRMHQNTSVFASSTEKTRGAIGTTTVVPYAALQIHGWINPLSAERTKLTGPDVDRMFAALWAAINNANTRTKSNQNSLLIMQVIYKGDAQKIYGLDTAIGLTPCDDKRDEQIRTQADYSLDFSNLENSVLKSDKVAAVRYYTETESISAALKKLTAVYPMLQVMSLSS